MRALNGLMLTYPVHQAADILFCRATLVPVGSDQLPHIEQARVICPALQLPLRAEPAGVPRARGDPQPGAGFAGHRRQKMSKSRNNAIAIGASADETARLLRGARTDSDPHITYEPATRPEISNLVLLTALCDDADPIRIADEIGSRGAAELKRRAADAVNERLRPIRTARAELIADRAHLREVLREGGTAGAAIGDQTLEAVGTAMHTSY